jgi:hypothetical protein
MMQPPFAVRYQDGITWIDRNADAAFRKALIDIVPVPLRGKMQRALAATPDPARDYAHSQRYFGDELPAIGERIKPLAMALERYFASARGLPGFQDWLILTGYANHYEMVKVFNEWAQMKREVKREEAANA